MEIPASVSCRGRGGEGLFGDTYPQITGMLPCQCRQSPSLPACPLSLTVSLTGGGGGPEKLPSPLPISQAQTIHVAREISQDLINERSRDREKRKEGRRVERRKEVEKL